MKSETVEIRLPAKIIAELSEVAKLAGVKVDTVIKVAMATKLRSAAPEADEAMRQDVEMFRWLADEWEKNGSVSFGRYAQGSAGCELFTITTQHVRGYEFRGAIKAAMTREK